MSRRRADWRAWLCGGYALLLLTLTHLPPGATSPWGVRIWDKFSHGLAYAGLGFLALWAASAPARVRLAPAMMKSLLILTAFAALDELTQPLVGRDADVRDWFADLLGMTMGLLAAAWWQRRAGLRRRRDYPRSKPRG